ncbi:MAG: hypothetical protein CSA34_08130 [Desulfobulbus propionicus]|nr:MAG: hypothetical protein CSA34_08130 [Desulfobulbus propionicus]
MIHYLIIFLDKFVLNVKLLINIFDFFFVAYASFTISGIISYFIGFHLIHMLIFSICIFIASFFYLAACSEESFIPIITKKESFFLCGFIIAAIIITLCLNRPDADDEGYLGLAVLFLDHLYIPLDDMPTGISKGYSLSYFEVFLATVSLVTGAPILVTYYFLVPSCLAAFAVLVHWRLLRLFVGNQWVVGMGIFLLVMLVWGDVHRTHANFGLARLFQGKAAFVTIVIPAIFFYFLEFYRTGAKRYAVLLFFTLATGVGCTPTGIIVGPMLLGLLIFANISLSQKDIRKNMMLAWGFVIPVFLAFIMHFYFGFDRRAVHTSHGLQAHTTNIEMLKFVLGDGFRGIFALLCLMLCPLCVTDRNIQKPLRNFVLLLIIMLIFPYTSEFIGKTTYATASWRWLWIIPFPLLIAVVMAKCFYLNFKIKRMKIGFIIFSILIIAYMNSSRRFVFSKENHARIGLPVFKLHDSKKIKLQSYKRYGFIQDNYLYINGTEKKF